MNKIVATIRQVDFRPESLGGGPLIPADSKGELIRNHKDGTSLVRFAKYGLRRFKSDNLRKSRPDSI